jgi:hypothetical protein
MIFNSKAFRSARFRLRGMLLIFAREKKIAQPVWPVWIHPGIAEHLFNSRVIKKTQTK